MKLDGGPMEIPLLGHGLQLLAGNIGHEINVKGQLAEETETGTDGREYAVFTIADDGTQPAGWAGTYRIDLTRLIQATTNLEGYSRILGKGAQG